MRKQTKLLIISAPILTLLHLAVALTHIETDARGVWNVHGPGFRVVYLDDVHHGAVYWLYIAGEFVGKWERERVEQRPYPTQVPYPTSTPYPTPTRGVRLQEA